MTMKITAAHFSACVVSKDALPDDGLPIIALLGRSNVGKSSLLNSLACRKELAKTSSLPGKTLTINFYCFNESFYLVDLPGYGYAKASKVTRKRIQNMMNEFFAESKNLKGVVQVLDIRHKPSVLDVQMHNWILDQKLNHMILLTKSDKLSNQQVIKMRSSIAKALKIDHPMTYSSKTGAGREDFLDAIEKIIAGFELKSSRDKKRRPASRGESADGKPASRRGRRKEGDSGAGSRAEKNPSKGSAVSNNEKNTPGQQQPNQPEQDKSRSRPRRRRRKPNKGGDQPKNNVG